MRAAPGRARRRRTARREPGHRQSAHVPLRRRDLQRGPDKTSRHPCHRQDGRRLVCSLERRVRAAAPGGMMKKQPFHNFVVDHMTFLVEPGLYNTTYALFRIILGVSKEDLIYEK